MHGSRAQDAHRNVGSVKSSHIDPKKEMLWRASPSFEVIDLFIALTHADLLRLRKAINDN